MSNLVERIKKRIEKEQKFDEEMWNTLASKDNRQDIAIHETRNALYDVIYRVIDEELAKEPQGDIPVQCVDGSCPMALAEEYEECGMDVVHSCDECQYKPTKEPQECKWIHEYNLYGDEQDAYTTSCSIKFALFENAKDIKYCPYCGRKIRIKK